MSTPMTRFPIGRTDVTSQFPNPRSLNRFQVKAGRSRFRPVVDLWDSNNANPNYNRPTGVRSPCGCINWTLAFGVFKNGFPHATKAILGGLYTDMAADQSGYPTSDEPYFTANSVYTGYSGDVPSVAKVCMGDTLYLPWGDPAIMSMFGVLIPSATPRVSFPFTEMDNWTLVYNDGTWRVWCMLWAWASMGAYTYFPSYMSFLISLAYFNSFPVTGEPGYDQPDFSAPTFIFNAFEVHA